jgi:hypothetical protein
MESGKYYVLSAGNNLTESMTKEQILSAITQAVESHTISDVDTGFVEKVKEQNSRSNLKFWVGTTAQYNALETKENNCFYILTDDLQFEDMESDIANLQSSVTEIQTTLAEQIEPNKVIYGNTGDDPIASGGTFEAATEIINKYKMFAFIVYYLDDNAQITDTVIVYRDPSYQGTSVGAVHFSAFYPQGNSLITKAFSVGIQPTATQNVMKFDGTCYDVDFAAGTTTNKSLYLKKLIGVI